MSDDVFDYDDSGYDKFDAIMKAQQEEAYFYHTLADFEGFIKELGAKYVLGEMTDDTVKQLKEAFKQC
jgi:ferredoxin